MADDDEFIREVDEEYRRDRIAQIWKRYQRPDRRPRDPARRGGRRLALLAARRAGPAPRRPPRAIEDARAALAGRQGGGGREGAAALATEAPAGYRLLARFRLAAELGKRDAEEGAKAYDALAADGTVDRPCAGSRPAARAPMLRIDTATPAAAQPGARAARRAGQSLAPHGARMLGLAGAEARRFRRGRALVRPDRGRPRDAAGPAPAARDLHRARRRRSGPEPPSRRDGDA